ncbi:fructosamine kinase family protein [Mitsuokella multacida]|uniref:fructosamine kinase family protein n=1 Tax=Mitsuokella multacida TaxID=52226 RepID=UPI003FEF10C6
MYGQKENISLPSGLANQLKHLYGPDARIVAQAPVGGGDINEAYHLVLQDGRDLFLKVHANVAADFFTAEASGLAALRQAGLPVPEVLGCGRNYLLLSYVKSARKSRDYWQQLGYELAKLHHSDPTAFTCGHRFGFTQDNYAGSTRQHNRPSDSWIDFFRTQRLQPFLKLCWSYFSSDEKHLAEQLLAHLEDRLIEPDFPSLLHGDLWCGNVMTGPAGEPIFIDPSVSVGFREVDIAKTELFGGFTGEFYDAYQEACPLDPGYPERRDLYNLYPLLNHLHLFGNAYHTAVTRILRHYA